MKLRSKDNDPLADRCSVVLSVARTLGVSFECAYVDLQLSLQLPCEHWAGSRQHYADYEAND